MKGHYLTDKEINDFSDYLRNEEKSNNTLKKYIRDITVFLNFARARLQRRRLLDINKD